MIKKLNKFLLEYLSLRTVENYSIPSRNPDSSILRLIGSPGQVTQIQLKLNREKCNKSN